jgi:hypothetical protein
MPKWSRRPYLKRLAKAIVGYTTDEEPKALRIA